MMIVPFEPEHILDMDLQPVQLHWLSRLTPQDMASVRDRGVAYTAMVNGKPIGCAGIMNTGFGTAMLWAMVAKDTGRYFVAGMRVMRRLIGLVPLRRLEATTECTFEAGCRALKLLGFECEGIMRRYGPDGSDHYRYARLS